MQAFITCREVWPKVRRFFQCQATATGESPDTGRALLMGAQDLDCGWRYGLFKQDFFYELASRARACGLGFGGEVAPDLTIYLDVPPEVALENLGMRIEGLFTPDDIRLQGV